MGEARQEPHAARGPSTSLPDSCGDRRRLREDATTLLAAYCTIARSDKPFHKHDGDVPRRNLAERRGSGLVFTQTNSIPRAESEGSTRGRRPKATAIPSSKSARRPRKPTRTFQVVALVALIIGIVEFSVDASRKSSAHQHGGAHRIRERGSECARPRPFPAGTVTEPRRTAAQRGGERPRENPTK